MKRHLQTLASLITSHDFKGLLTHYKDSSESENMSQLAFLFQQAKKKPTYFEFLEQLATRLIPSKDFPLPLIERINNSDTLNFFTQALKESEAFNITDQNQRNVIHYLMSGDQSAAQHSCPPFNYLRSMMLFESNEALHDALCQRDRNQLTPIEVYLAKNVNLAPLVNHQFTAVLGLIEIQSKKQPIQSSNLKPILNAVKKLCTSQKITYDSELQRLQFIAAYYAVPIEGLCG
jgi:hypothetical protein